MEVVTQFCGILHSLLLDVVHAGCSLKLMLDWAWDRVVEIKNQLDQLCKFAHSHSLLLEHDNFCGARGSVASIELLTNEMLELPGGSVNVRNHNSTSASTISLHYCLAN